jgi:DNA-directed RNA polymerase specialized sigma24 family protein
MAHDGSRSLDTAPPGAIDEATFRELYPALWRFAAAISAAPVDPDDLVQDALTAVLRRPAGAEPIASPAAYLRQAVLNAERSQRRTAVRRRTVDPLLVTDDAVTPTYPSDLAVLDGLAADDRALLYLTVVERWTFAEVATLLDKSESGLRMRATRLRRALRDQLAADDLNEEHTDE